MISRQGVENAQNQPAGDSKPPRGWLGIPAFARRISAERARRGGHRARCAPGKRRLRPIPCKYRRFGPRACADGLPLNVSRRQRMNPPACRHALHARAKRPLAYPPAKRESKRRLCAHAGQAACEIHNSQTKQQQFANPCGVEYRQSKERKQ